MPENSSESDKVYADPQARIEAFAFDENVAAVFDDMIRRSVPGYGMTLSLLGIIARHYAKPNSRIYDLGCSLGAGLVSMASQLEDRSIEFIGVDNSEAMLESCSDNTENLRSRFSIQLNREDILDTNICNASIVALNFTLQFIPKDQRPELLQHIQQGLQPGGVLVLSEKIRFDDPHIQADLTTLHHDFKKANGYSDLEISQKRSALENVLIPETIDKHQQRLKNAGFARSEVWLQCFNFASLLAFK